MSANGRAILSVPVEGGPPTVLDTLPFVGSPVGATYDGEWFVVAVVGVDGDVWRIEDFDLNR